MKSSISVTGNEYWATEQLHHKHKFALIQVHLIKLAVVLDVSGW